MFKEIKCEIEMNEFGKVIGALLHGGEFIELSGDVGSGKTTLTKGIATGMGVSQNVQSPSFTIKRVYETDGALSLCHYDFYRLNEAGIMSNELAESASDKNAVTVIEWGDVVEGILPTDRLSIKISVPTETSRHLVLLAGGKNSRNLMEQLVL